MKRIYNLIFSLFVSILSLSLFSCITDDYEEEFDEECEVDLKVGDKLPKFSVIMNDGSRLSTRDLLGSCSVIVLFNTHCRDCKKELPVIQKIYDKYGKRLKLVCISREERDSYIQKYWKNHQLSLPYSAQEDAHIYHLFATSVVPRVYVSDKDLIIRAIFTDDPIATEEELDAEIHKVLNE